MKYLCSTLLAFVLILVSLVGCKNQENSNKTDNVANTQEKHSVAVVTDTGGIHDQSFNQSAYEDGLIRLKDELNFGITCIESTQDADYSTNLDRATDQNCDIVWGIGYKGADAMKNVANKNPMQQYGLIDYIYEDDPPKNVICVVYNDNEAAFLIGYLAAKLANTNKVGFVGGIKGAVIDKFEYGFRAGVDYYNKLNDKNIEVCVQYADSFNDITKGKDIAAKMHSDDCGIIYHAAGAVGKGILEEAKERNKFKRAKDDKDKYYVMGVDRDQSIEAPDVVIASSMKLVGKTIFNITNELTGSDDNVPIDKQYILGLREEAVGIAFGKTDLVDEKTKQEINDIKEKIINGEIIPPINEQTYKEFKA